MTYQGKVNLNLVVLIFPSTRFPSRGNLAEIRIEKSRDSFKLIQELTKFRLT